jgi:hypothetical protein
MKTMSWEKQFLLDINYSLSISKITSTNHPLDLHIREHVTNDSGIRLLARVTETWLLSYVPPCNFRQTCRVRGSVPDHKKIMYGRELNSQITSQRQRVRAQEQNKMKAEYLAAGSKNWQPFCQEKCVQNLVKFADLLRTRVGQSAGVQVGGVMGCFCVVAAELSTRTSKFWMTIPGPGRLGGGHARPLVVGTCGDVAVSPAPFSSYLLHFSVAKLRWFDFVWLFFLSTKFTLFQRAAVEHKPKSVNKSHNTQASVFLLLPLQMQNKRGGYWSLS